MEVRAQYVPEAFISRVAQTHAGNKRSPHWLLGFSFSGNTRRLLDTTGDRRPGVISCLNGVRFLSMVWVLVGHSYNFSNEIAPTINENYVATEVLNVQTMRRCPNVHHLSQARVRAAGHISVCSHTSTTLRSSVAQPFAFRLN